MKTNKKILLRVTGILIGTIVAVIMVRFVTPKDNADTSLAAEIEENFAAMSSLSVGQTLSSNPYDYINNEYYEKIVSLGIPAIKVLEDNYNKGVYTGLNSYVAALAIQDIANINLYECTGTDWETSEEFFDKWDEIMRDMPNIFNKIANSDEPIFDKMEEFEKYGIFGQSFIATAKTAKNNTFEFSGEKIVLHGKLNFTDVSTVPTKKLKEVNEYLQSIAR